MSTSFVHLVIPAYNEGGRLPAYLPRLCEALADKSCPPWRITVVDDGSHADDAQAMKKCAESCGSRVTYQKLAVNSGKGAAVYTGWDSDHSSEWLGLLDADGSIPPSEVLRLLRSLDESRVPDALFGSRCKILGHTVERSWIRHVCGRLFATVVCLATGIPVYDSQCGFKLVRRRCYEAVRPSLREKRFAFDVELLVNLRKSGAQIVEVPIDWSDIPGTKVHFFRDTTQMLVAILGMKMRNSN